MHYSTIDKLPHVVIIIIPYTLALVCVFACFPQYEKRDKQTTRKMRAAGDRNARAIGLKSVPTFPRVHQHPLAGAARTLMYAPFGTKHP